MITFDDPLPPVDGDISTDAADLCVRAEVMVTSTSHNSGASSGDPLHAAVRNLRAPIAPTADPAVA